LIKKGGSSAFFYSRSPIAVKERCALSRANRVFRTDEKHIRTKNTVMDETLDSLSGFFSEILDGARMCFSSVRHRGSARTGRRPRKLRRFSSTYPAIARQACFGADEKRIRTKNTVVDKNTNILE